jgi:hypothetical protein
MSEASEQFARRGSLAVPGCLAWRVTLRRTLAIFMIVTMSRAWFNDIFLLARFSIDRQNPDSCIASSQGG